MRLDLDRSPLIKLGVQRFLTQKELADALGVTEITVRIGNRGDQRLGVNIW